MPKSIYLDSNDFSDLSAPEDHLKSEDASVLAALRRATTNGSVIVLLSPPLLSEAVHASEASKEHAVQRAKLMRQLCSPRFLRYPTDIFTLELDRVLQTTSAESLTLDDIVSREDEWFGTRLDIRSLDETRKNAQKRINEHLDQLPRAERRKLKSQLSLFKASSRPMMRRLMKENRLDNNEFPLNLIDQDKFNEWLLGGTNFDLHKHLRSLLSDPYILFKHLIDHMGQRDQLYNIVRKGGDRLSKSLANVGENLIKLAEVAALAGRPLNLRDLANDMFSDANIRSIFVPLSDGRLEKLEDPQLNTVLKNCPSARILIHVLREYVHTLIQSNFSRFKHGNKTATPTKRSDFGDLMHIWYAPYVDIFRCDARFGEHLKTYKPLQNRIAARRGDILGML